jgi:hypothetical protein
VSAPIKVEGSSKRCSGQSGLSTDLRDEGLEARDLNFRGLAATQARGVDVPHSLRGDLLPLRFGSLRLQRPDRDAIGSHRSAAVAPEQQSIPTPENGADAGEEDDGPRRMVTLRRQRRSFDAHRRCGDYTAARTLRISLMGSPGTVPLLIGDRGLAADVCIT